jgi:uncharacterized protein YndB with AHSA1/START domain
MDGIRWPPEFDPAETPIHVRNELEIAAPCEVVWAWLIRAQHWPEWYENSKDVRFITGSPPDLTRGAHFQWSTFGVSLDSNVRELEAPERLAWDARGTGVNAYHAWLLTPTLRGGCHALTEETQHGWMARTGHTLMPSRMSKWHQVWLESLAERAKQGMPA